MADDANGQGAMQAAHLPLAEPGLWVERIGGREFGPGLPALFLDRDGTINLDTDYPDDPAEIVLRKHIAPAIRRANQAGIPVVVVTNQSGIARGYFGWPQFKAVNARVLELLARQGAGVDLVIACAYFDAGDGPLSVKDHAMRKPNPGMLKLAAQLLDIELARSIIVGDKVSDMQAGYRAGLRRGWLVGDGGVDLPGFQTCGLNGKGDLDGLLDAIRGLRAA